MSGEGPHAAVPRQRRPTRTAMLVALGIDALGSGLYLPLSLLYFTLVVGLPLRDVGLALSAATALTLPVPLLAGACADRFGARRIVVAAQVLQGVGFCGYLFVHGIAALLVAALLVGIGERSYWTTVFTFVAETSAGRQLDAWYARISVTRSLGTGSGALLAGLVVGSGRHGLYEAAIIANAVSFGVAAILLATMVTDDRTGDRTADGPGRAGNTGKTGKTEKTSKTGKTGNTGSAGQAAGGYRTVLRDRPFLAFTATNLAYSLCLTTVVVALPVYVVKGLAGPGWLAGTLFTVNTAVLVLTQALVTRTVAVHRRTRVLAAAGVLWVLWSLAMAAGPRVPHAALIPFLIAGMLVFTVAEMMQSPTSTALAAAASITELRGRYMAVYQYGYQVAKIIAPILFTQLFVVGPGLPWLVLAILTACAIPALLLLERSLPAEALRPKPPEEAPDPSDEAASEKETSR
ncbi:MFS family permease [Catenulispora sp. GP43]|uniref:MFS transporter n=1 Tax=Catenulispora sp. GP43 TaxID=3156263 RepID=UPI003512C3C3